MTDLIRLFIIFFAGNQPAQPEYRLIAENLSSQTRRQDLKNYMPQAGEVLYDHKTSSSEGEKVHYIDIFN